MLFMVIGRFKSADPEPVRLRFEQSGRMMPPGLTYHASWVDVTGSRCFQLVETAEPRLFEEWLKHWKDIVSFEIVPVLEASQFWSQYRQP